MKKWYEPNVGAYVIGLNGATGEGAIAIQPPLTITDVLSDIFFYYMPLLAHLRCASVYQVTI